jgi:hypothetical protein
MPSVIRLSVVAPKEELRGVYTCDENGPILQSQMIGCCKVKEQHASKNENNGWNTNISFYLETSGGQNSNLYSIVVHFFNTSVI